MRQASVRGLGLELEQLRTAVCIVMTNAIALQDLDGNRYALAIFPLVRRCSSAGRLRCQGDTIGCR